MTLATRATCTRALYAHLDLLRRDVRDNADYFDKLNWLGQRERQRTAVELLRIRRALRELAFIEWGTRAAA